jgi:hypothetical protein
MNSWRNLHDWEAPEHRAWFYGGLCMLFWSKTWGGHRHTRRQKQPGFLNGPGLRP